MHVHTRRYSPCAETLDPNQLHRIMELSDLDGLVITEHDRLWPMEDIALLNRQLENRRIYRGVEVSSSNGHFIVIGLERLVGIGPGIGIEKLLHLVEADQAAIIWAHPQLYYGNTPNPLKGGDMPEGLHAVEVASSLTVGQDILLAKALARRMNCATVGGSDAHAPGQVGCAFTLFPDLPGDEQSLAAAIRKGCCAAMHRSSNICGS